MVLFDAVVVRHRASEARGSMSPGVVGGLTMVVVVVVVAMVVGGKAANEE